MPRSSGAVSPHGEQQLLKASEMKVLPHIQRRATESRLRGLAGNWDPDKEGIILVALINGGPHANVLHPYDGGTRVLAQQVYGDPDHKFVCWVRRMSEKQAAKAFLAHNVDSRKPSMYSQYMVALEAGDDWAHAIDRALTAVGVQVGEYAARDKLAAIKACERIVTHRSHAGDFNVASDHLKAVLRLTMAGYPNSGEAYDADLIQAVSRIMIDNPTLDRDRLRAVMARKPVGLWRQQAQNVIGSLAGTSGGSESRALMLRRELIHEYNKRLSAPKHLS